MCYRRLMKRILFYSTLAGRCPVQEHLDTLPDKTVAKIAWVLRAVRDLDRVPGNYLKKLVNTMTYGKSALMSAGTRFDCWGSSMSAN